VPDSLEALVLASLAKNPEERPESASAFQSALGNVDGVGWTARDAEAWWRGRGREIRAAMSGGSRPKAPGAPKTLDIDPAREQGAGAEI
jgi:hypothetical protein